MPSQIIKDLVESPHPIHKRYCSYRNFLLSSYEGGVDYTNAVIQKGSSVSFWDSVVKVFANGQEIGNPQVSGNLFKHKKERSEDFISRIEQSYYYNFCAPVIDIYTNHLFKQPIIEDFLNIEKFLEYRKENIDEMGSSINEFRKEMASVAQLYGHCFVVVDMPQDRNEITFEDRILNNKFPYFNIYHPQNVINWALDEKGMPYWVLLAESKDSGVDYSTVKKDRKESVQYRLWTRDKWEVYDAEYNMISTGIHSIGLVPIVCVFNKQSKKAKSFLGVSEIADISFIARDIYNACSELKQILRDQTFAFLAVQGKSSDYNEAVIGVNKGLVYPEGANVPQYVSPPSSNADVYFQYIDRQVHKIFQMAKLEGGTGEFQGQSAVQQSGVSKAWDFNQTNSALSQKAGNLNDAEEKIWNMFALWEGQNKFEGSIKYPDEFSIQSVNEDLDEAEKMARLNLGKETDFAVKESIIKKKFPRASEEEIDAMVESMKSVVPEKAQPNRLAERLGLFKTGIPKGRGELNGN